MDAPSSVFSNAPTIWPGYLYDFGNTNGALFEINYVNLEGLAKNDIVLTLMVVPEPSALTLVGAGLLLLLATSRCRRH